MSIKFNSLLSKGLLFIGVFSFVVVLMGSFEKQVIASEMESTVGIEFTGEGSSKLPDTDGEEVTNEARDDEGQYLPQTGESKVKFQGLFIGIWAVGFAMCILSLNKLKKSKFRILFVSLLVGLLVSINTVDAADGGQIISKSDIGFEENTDITNPVDPINPDKPLKPVKPPTPGPLSLNYVSDIQFGSYDLADLETIFYASLDTIEYADSSEKDLKRPNFVELTDNRGLNTGWKLTVKQNGALRNTKGTELTGAQLAFKNTSVHSLDEISAVPTGFSKDIVTLSDSQNVLVLAAEQGTGMGSWSIQFGQDTNEGKKSVLLTVPKGSVKENGYYSTSLTWTLSDSI